MTRASMPGVVRVTLLGSSMQYPASSPPKPCHDCWGSRVQHEGSVSSRSSGASTKGNTVFDAGSRTTSGCQTPKNHGASPSGLFASSRARVTIRFRNCTASRIAPCTRTSPPGPSIIAEATSRQAIIG